MAWLTDMRILRRLSVGRRLFAAFALVSLVFLLALGIGWLKIGSVAAGQGTFSHTASEANAAAAAAYNMRISQAQNVNIMGRVPNPDGSDMHTGDVAEFDAALKALEGGAHDSASRDAVAAIRADYAHWTALDTRLASLIASDDHTAATTLANADVNDAGDALAQALTALGDQQSAAGDAATSGAVGSVRIILDILVLIALGVAALLAVVATRSLTRPIDAIRLRLEEIADGDGDLTQRVDEDREDEIGDLGKAFNRFAAGRSTERLSRFAAAWRRSPTATET